MIESIISKGPDLIKVAVEVTVDPEPDEAIDDAEELDAELNTFSPPAKCCLLLELLLICYY